jgi:hypothetical protein
MNWICEEIYIKVYKVVTKVVNISIKSKQPCTNKTKFINSTRNKSEVDQKH